jgi:hypothetical protein
MAGTRSSSRKTGNSSSPAKGDDAVAGTKRKPEAEPSPKRGRKSAKKQATLEETLGVKEDGDSEMKDASGSEQNGDTQNAPDGTSNGHEAKNGDDDEKANGTKDEVKEKTDDRTAKVDSSKGQVNEDVDDTTATADTANESVKSESKDGGAVQESSQREKEMPSNILEKGLIYFFTRNRVGIDDADSVGDLQRTFFVLRPLPTGAKLGDGAIPDLKNNRLLALPKKTFPKSHNDRFMAFVEKANTTIQDLKENFMQGSKYETKTQGTRQVDPVTPVAEGVYAITRTEDRTTHLVYSTTIPSELGEMQEDLGIKDQGSFIISVKNPERSGPASASLPQKPGFPKEYVSQRRV